MFTLLYAMAFTAIALPLLSSLAGAHFYSGSSGHNDTSNCGVYADNDRPCPYEDNNNEIVDVFFSQLKAGNDPHLYYGSSIEGMVHSIEVMLAQSIDSGRRNIRVHIISDIPEVLQLNFSSSSSSSIQSSTSSQTGNLVTLYDAAAAPFLSIREEFWALYQYRHHSYNEVGYEFTCFLRWLLYNKIAQESGSSSSSSVVGGVLKGADTSPSLQRPPMARIVALDADVLFMHRIDEVYSRAVISLTRDGNCSHAFSDFDVVVLGFGSVHLFSAAGLDRYSEFVTSLYEQSVAAVKSHVWRGGRFRHYSDMDRMNEFVEADRRHRSSCLASSRRPRLVSQSCSSSSSKSSDKEEKGEGGGEKGEATAAAAAAASTATATATCYDHQALGCVVANSVKAFENVADLKVLLRVLVDVVKRKEGRGEKENENESDHRVNAVDDEKRLHELVQVTGSLLNHDHAHGSSRRDPYDPYLPGNLTLCYMHFQGGHKRVAVSWGLVLRHLYGRYLQLRRPQEEKRERLFVVKVGYTDVMYVDENLRLREAGTLGTPPFADVKGLTIHNEQNRDDPLQLLWYINVRLKSPQGEGEGVVGRMVMVEDALYYSFENNGKPLNDKERLAVGL